MGRRFLGIVIVGAHAERAAGNKKNIERAFARYAVAHRNLPVEGRQPIKAHSLRSHNFAKQGGIKCQQC